MTKIGKGDAIGISVLLTLLAILLLIILLIPFPINVIVTVGYLCIIWAVAGMWFSHTSW